MSPGGLNYILHGRANRGTELNPEVEITLLGEELAPCYTSFANFLTTTPFSDSVVFKITFEEISLL